MCMYMFACVWAEMGTHVDKLCIHILILAVLRGSGWLNVSHRETWSWVKTFLVLTNAGEDCSEVICGITWARVKGIAEWATHKQQLTPP